MLFGDSVTLARALDEVGTGQMRVSFGLARANGASIDVAVTVAGSALAGLDELAQVLVFKHIGDQRRVELELGRIERLASAAQLAAGSAHEIRNPLAGLQGLAELMLAETPTEHAHHDYLKRMLATVKRLERLVRVALDSAEPAPTRPRACDLAALVAQVLRSLGLGSAPQPTLVVESSSLAWADPEQVAECLRSLVVNALDAVAGAGEVEIRIGQETGDRVRACVRDSGPGIPEGHLERIFDPFFTTKSTRAGLGLASAQAIAVRNGGSLGVRSRPGDTVFCLRLPTEPRELGARRP